MHTQNQVPFQKQFQVRRQAKGSPLLKTNQVQQMRNSSLLSDQQHHLKIKQFEECEINNPFERRIQKQTQLQNKQENIFTFNNITEQQSLQQLNAVNAQLVNKNKVLQQKLKMLQKMNEQAVAEKKELHEKVMQLEARVQHYQDKVYRLKMKKTQLREQAEMLSKELEELKERCQSNQQDQDEDEQQHIPLTHDQLQQLMLILQQQAQRQQYAHDNYSEYQDREIDPDNMTYEELLELEERMGSVPKGLSLRQIKELPVRVLQTGEVPLDKCSVCLFEFQEAEEVRDLPCKHVYHSKCIKQWLKNNKSCPICKTEVIIPLPELQSGMEEEEEDEEGYGEGEEGEEELSEDCQ